MMNDKDSFRFLLEDVLESSNAETRYQIVAAYDQAIARAEAAEAALRELRENVMLGLGMAADDVAAVDDESADATISYLLAGHKELAAEVARLTAENAALRAQLDAGEGWPVSEEPITIPITLFNDLLEVASWFRSVCNGMEAGETIHNHPDLDAFYYLKNEGAAILARAEALKAVPPQE